MDSSSKFIALAFIALASCNQHPWTAPDTEAPTAAASPNATTASGLSWDNYAKEFFAKECLNCHPSYATESGVDSDLATIEQDIANGSMPVGSTLTPAQQANITEWIKAEQTALNDPNGVSHAGNGNSVSDANGTAAPTPSPAPGGACTADTYANYGQAFFTANCTGCHPSMSTYSVIAAESASIQQDITSGSMPQGKQLDAATKTRIVTWINCGMPQ